MAEKKKASTDGKKPSFEEALAKLEGIVDEMESGEVSLEKMMKDFEEGTQLVKYCTAKLNEVEKKIELLVKKGDKVATETFDEASVDD